MAENLFQENDITTAFAIMPVAEAQDAVTELALRRPRYTFVCDTLERARQFQSTLNLADRVILQFTTFIDKLLPLPASVGVFTFNRVLEITNPLVIERGVSIPTDFREYRLTGNGIFSGKIVEEVGRTAAKSLAKAVGNIAAKLYKAMADNRISSANRYDMRKRKDFVIREIINDIYSSVKAV